eukprot:TRINITY_DN758_c2_g3_i1.p1 TRINITY_DN758_c2_g3~~TRINITY_DN758_c2_g3_i1.p1  ORF type:complete len:2061 (-),score=458.91 TRINITY_DN758_c2_g3_i1:628-6810(-)
MAATKDPTPVMVNGGQSSLAFQTRRATLVLAPTTQQSITHSFDTGTQDLTVECSLSTGLKVPLPVESHFTVDDVKKRLFEALPGLFALDRRKFVLGISETTLLQDDQLFICSRSSIRQAVLRNETVHVTLFSIDAILANTPTNRFGEQHGITSLFESGGHDIPEDGRGYGDDEPSRRSGSLGSSWVSVGGGKLSKTTSSISSGGSGASGESLGSSSADFVISSPTFVEKSPSSYSGSTIESGDCSSVGSVSPESRSDSFLSRSDSLLSRSDSLLSGSSSSSTISISPAHQRLGVSLKGGSRIGLLRRPTPTKRTPSEKMLSSFHNPEKEGWLKKEGLKYKNWKRRWCILKNNFISYFKSRQEGAPVGAIPLTDAFGCEKTDEKLNKFKIMTRHRTYYLIAETTKEMNEWMVVVNKAVAANAKLANADRHRDRASSAVVNKNSMQVTTQGAELKGWLRKSNPTHTNLKKRFCILRDQFIYYFKTDSSSNPCGAIPLQDCVVQVKENGRHPYCFCITTRHRTYDMVADTEVEMNRWLEVVRKNDHSQAQTPQASTMSLERGGSDAPMPWVRQGGEGSATIRWELKRTDFRPLPLPTPANRRRERAVRLAQLRDEFGLLDRPYHHFVDEGGRDVVEEHLQTLKAAEEEKQRRHAQRRQKRQEQERLRSDPHGDFPLGVDTEPDTDNAKLASLLGIQTRSSMQLDAASLSIPPDSSSSSSGFIVPPLPSSKNTSPRRADGSTSPSASPRPSTTASRNSKLKKQSSHADSSELSIFLDKMENLVLLYDVVMEFDLIDTIDDDPNALAFAEKSKQTGRRSRLISLQNKKTTAAVAVAGGDSTESVGSTESAVSGGGGGGGGRTHTPPATARTTEPDASPDKRRMMLNVQRISTNDLLQTADPDASTSSDTMPPSPRSLKSRTRTTSVAYTLHDIDADGSRSTSSSPPSVDSVLGSSPPDRSGSSPPPQQRREFKNRTRRAGPSNSFGSGGLSRSGSVAGKRPLSLESSYPGGMVLQAYTTTDPLPPQVPSSFPVYFRFPSADVTRSVMCRPTQTIGHALRSVLSKYVRTLASKKRTLSDTADTPPEGLTGDSSPEDSSFEAGDDLVAPTPDELVVKVCGTTEFILDLSVALHQLVFVREHLKKRRKVQFVLLPAHTIRSVLDHQRACQSRPLKPWCDEDARRLWTLLAKRRENEIEDMIANAPENLLESAGAEGTSLAPPAISPTASALAVPAPQAGDRRSKSTLLLSSILSQSLPCLPRFLESDLPSSARHSSSVAVTDQAPLVNGGTVDRSVLAAETAAIDTGEVSPVPTIDVVDVDGEGGVLEIERRAQQRHLDAVSALALNERRVGGEGAEECFPVASMTIPFECRVICVENLRAKDMLSQVSAVVETDVRDVMTFVECSLFYCGELVGTIMRTPKRKNSMLWGDRLINTVRLQDIMRETRVCFTFLAQCGDVDVPLGWVNVQLFDCVGTMASGKRVFPLWPSSRAPPVGTCTVNDDPDASLLHIEFLKGPLPVAFVVDVPRPFQEGSSTPSDEETIQLHRVLEQNPLEFLTEEDRQLVWRYRYYVLYKRPTNVTKFLRSVSWQSRHHVDETHALLSVWPHIDPMDALELLDYNYADARVREYAVDCLRQMSDRDLVNVLLQLVQVLKYEVYHDTALSRFLLQRALKNKRRVGHAFFWHLKSELHICGGHSTRYQLLLEMFLSACDEEMRLELKRQTQLIAQLEVIALEVKAARPNRRNKVMETLLEELRFDGGSVYLPLDPCLQVQGVIVSKCKWMDSFTVPLWLVFENADPDGDPIFVIFKVGDDMRQDVLTLQLFAVMERLWQQEGLDLHITPYNCVSTGENQGLIEIVLGAATVADIEKIAGGATAALFGRTPIARWLQDHNGDEEMYASAVENFTLSLAGYCVGTYILGIGDRHNDNIMVTKSGHVFHIDFAHFLGNIMKFAGFKRERAAFVLTPAYAHVMGGRDGEAFQTFKRLCGRGYNILRKHSEVFFTLFMMMLSTGIPQLTNMEDLQYLQKSFSLELSDPDAESKFSKLILESLDTRTTQINNAIHIMAHPD